MNYDNEITDRGNWTDQDIVDMFENNHGLDEWRREEQDYINNRYKDIQTRYFLIEIDGYFEDKEVLNEIEMYLQERARKLSGLKIKL